MQFRKLSFAEISEVVAKKTKSLQRLEIKAVFHTPRDGNLINNVNYELADFRRRYSVIQLNGRLIHDDTHAGDSSISAKKSRRRSIRAKPINVSRASRLAFLSRLRFYKISATLLPHPMSNLPERLLRAVKFNTAYRLNYITYRRSGIHRNGTSPAKCRS